MNDMGKRKTTAAAQIEGQLDIATLMPPEGAFDTIFQHPEYGDYFIRMAPPPIDEFEELYFDWLCVMVRRKWDKLFFGGPYPKVTRAEFIQPKDLEPDCPFAPIQGIVIETPEKPWNARFMRPGRLEASFAKNRCMCLDLGDRQMAISPFHEWELADFWEGKHYDND